MEIKKGNINLWEQTSRAHASVLVESDIVVADTKPDIAEILMSDAKAKVKDTDYRNGVLKVVGEVEFTALYKPEEGAELKCVVEKLEFSESFDIKGDENTEFTVNAAVEHIGFTLVNSRKLSSKVMVALSVVAMQENNYEPVIEVAGDDVESRDKKYSIYIPMSDAETEITVSDILTVPDDKPDIGEILKVDAWVIPADTKVMNAKAMVHGDLHINTVYTAADDGRVTGVSHTVPFTEIVEAPGADEQSVINVTFDVLEVFAGTKGDLNGDTKIISIEGKICARVKVSRTVAETIVDDCYCLSGKTEISHDSMKISEYVTSENARLSARQTVEAPKNVKINEVINCCAKPMLRECIWENGAIKVNGSLVTFLIYRDGDGEVRCAVTESDINWEKTISDPCEIEANMWFENVNADVTENGVQILVNMGLFMKAVKSRRVDILTNVSQKEDTSITKMHSMVIYFAKDGDTVWSVAKKYRTKAEKIKNANNLDTDKIEVGRRLLIPKA